MLFASPTLSIKPTYLLFFLKPSANVPEDSTVVDGDVVLHLPQAKRVKHIDVELIGTQSMRCQGRRLSYTTLHRKITLEAGSLDAGSHHFRFSFIVPANTAPKERLGEYQIQIKRQNNDPPHGGQVSATQVHMLRATVKGIGSPFGGDLTAQHEVVLHAVHQDGPPSGYNRREELLHDVLGPMRASFFARFMIISGFVRLKLELPTILQDCILADIRVVLIQDVHLQDMTKPERNEEVPPWHVTLWQLPAEGPKYRGMRLPAGDNLYLTEVCRMPSEVVIRQTTSEFSDTGIRVSHKISLVIQYRTMADGELKQLNIKFPAQIASCDCSVENLQVPGYNETTNFSSAIPEDIKYTHCVCMLQDYIGIEEVERLYGFRDYVQPEEVYSGPEQDKRTKWEREEEERRSTSGSRSRSR